MFSRLQKPGLRAIAGVQKLQLRGFSKQTIIAKQGIDRLSVVLPQTAIRNYSSDG